MVCKTCKHTKARELRKPRRPPPAPPVPPKDSSPAQSYSSLSYHNSTSDYNCISGHEAPSESCYSEGVQSVKSVPYSTQSCQPRVGSSYWSAARSDYECYSAAASECCSGAPSVAHRLPSCCRRSCLCELTCHCSTSSPVACHTPKSRGFAASAAYQHYGCGNGANGPATARPHNHHQYHQDNCNHMSCSQSTLDSAGRHPSSPLPPLPVSSSSKSTQSHHSLPRPQPPPTATLPPLPPQPPLLMSTQAAALQQVHQQPPQTPPVPQERKNMPRPQLSISPGPQLKRQPDKQRRKYVCEPLSYRRHIEQHIERVFKYLKDRQKRLDECESAIHAELKPKDEESIRKMLALKETRYLRSLRTRLSSKDFQEIQRLGEGFIGKVSLVEKVDTKNLYAMKKMRKSQVILQNHMAHVMAERDILAEADNEWIVKLYYSFQDEHYLFFILEYCPGGDMMNLLINKRVFPENWARFYIAEISLALQFVHDMRFIHRDIKPDNILIDAKGHIKLADFGLCTGFRWTHDLKYYRDETLNNLNNNNMNTNGNNLHGGGLSILGSHQDQSDDHPTITKALTRREMEYSLKRRSLSLVGSPNYIAPEVLRRDSTNERLCDWWSVGVILYEMVIGFCPFIDVEAVSNNRYNPMLDTAEKIQQRIVEWRRYLVFTSNNDPKSPNLMPDVHGNLYEPSEAVKSLIRGWICDPHERLCQNGIADIKSHPFFKGFDWDRIRMMEAPFVPELRNSHDTSHFDPAAQGQQNNEHGTLGANINRQLAMNHFTYRAFWNKPLSGGLL